MPRPSDYVTVVCPSCGKVYEKRMNWTGNGTPRIRCELCKSKVKSISDKYIGVRLSER